MAKQTSRLGRSLGSLISKGAETPISSPSPSTKAKKPVKKAIAPATKKTAKKPQVVKEQLVIEESPFQEIAIDKVRPNPYQPRMEIHPNQIRELAQSIEEEGLLQPIVVRKQKDHFELIAGERRWRATQQLKKDTILARIIEASDASSAVISLVENLQRENLNPVDEAMGYASLMRDFDLTQEEVAKRIGKARATIANSLRLTQLEQEIQGYLAKGLISTGHAKLLLGLENPSQRLLMARRIIEGNLSVRESERIIQNLKRDTGLKSISRPISVIQNAVIRDLQKQLSSHLNTQVDIQHNAKKGKLVINYKGNEELQRILEKIGVIGPKSNFAA